MSHAARLALMMRFAAAAKMIGGHRAPRQSESDVHPKMRAKTTARARAMVGNVFTAATE
jgi:hypothetical protein